MSLWCTQGHLAWQQRIEKEMIAATRSITHTILNDPERLDDLRSTLKIKRTSRTSRRSMDLDTNNGTQQREGSLPSISRHSRMTSSSKVQSLLEKHSSSTQSSMSKPPSQQPEELLKLKEQLYQEKKMRETIEEELQKLKELYYKK